MPDDIIREVYAALLCRRLTKPLQVAARLLEAATGDRPRNTIELVAIAADFLELPPEAVLGMTANELVAQLQRAAAGPQSSPTLEQDMDNLTDVRLTKAEVRAVEAFAAAARELSSDTAEPPTIRAAFDYIVSCGDYGYDHDDFEGFKKALLRGRKKLARALAREPRSAVKIEHFYGR